MDGGTARREEEDGDGMSKAHCDMVFLSLVGCRLERRA